MFAIPDWNRWANLQLLPNAPSVQLALVMKRTFAQEVSRKRESLSLFSFFEKEDVEAESWNRVDASSDTAAGLDPGIITEETGSNIILVQKSALML